MYILYDFGTQNKRGKALIFVCIMCPNTIINKDYFDNLHYFKRHV
jgi:hypothetical protein